MKNNEDMLIRKLEALDVPDIEMSRHGHLLRSQLLSSSHFQSPRTTYFSTLTEYFLRINRIINQTIMVQKKSFAFSGALVALVAVVAIGFGGFSGSNVTHAEASALVEKSVTVATNITPEMRARIEAVIDVDMVAILEEAYVAPDLKVLTKEEIPNFNLTPAESGKITKVNSAVEITKVENGVSLTMVAPAVKFMSYTNPKGVKTILGLAEDDTLVFASIDSVN